MNWLTELNKDILVWGVLAYQIAGSAFVAWILIRIVRHKPRKRRVK